MWPQKTILLTQLLKAKENEIYETKYGNKYS